jgi:endonuclease III
MVFQKPYHFRQGKAPGKNKENEKEILLRRQKAEVGQMRTHLGRIPGAGQKTAIAEVEEI